MQASIYSIHELMAKKSVVRCLRQYVGKILNILFYTTASFIYVVVMCTGTLLGKYQSNEFSDVEGSKTRCQGLASLQTSSGKP